ncbi:peptidoglycan editing factor PgeF [Pelosinus sp. sgz500959]|uniref:peptidoglycan editing factor PgeF n=1 Tax=Pelosinus sp. sgz500959 TaxID=3242472 RepID=UPI003671264D
MEGFVLKYGSHGLWYGTFPHFDQLGIKHGVSTRLGGTSVPPFSSLNLGLHTGDDDQHVIANRQLFCEAVGTAAKDVVTAEQVHADKIIVVTSEHLGKGATVYREAIEGTDALITNTPGIPLLLFFADCVPVLIVDPIKKVIGLVHAGWKGTVNKIAQKTILAMQTQFGTLPENCLVGIAPSIGPCCYEVDHVVALKVKDQFKNWEQLLRPAGDKWHLDLWSANRLQLEEIGVNSSHIVVSDVCTACNNELFFSYRAENGCTGRIGAVIVL